MSRQGMIQYSAWPYSFLAFPLFPVSVDLLFGCMVFLSLFPSRNLPYYLGMHLTRAHGLIELLYLGSNRRLDFDGLGQYMVSFDRYSNHRKRLVGTNVIYAV